MTEAQITHPELQSMLDTLSTLSISANSEQALSIAETARAKELCLALQNKQRLVFQSVGDGAIVRVIYHLLFSTSISVRRGAQMFLEAAAKDLPKDFNIFNIDKLKSEGEYNKWMMKEIIDGKVDGLKGLELTIMLLGTYIHKQSGTKLLNGLLSLAEKGFKSDSTRMRTETFSAWEILIDNFSMDKTILTHPKRIKLITRPLAANNNMNKEPLALAKFNAWWHFLYRMGPDCVNCLSSTVIPFFEFCYGKPTSGENAKDQIQQQHSNGTALFSPLKRFGSITGRTLESFAHLLNCPVQNGKLKPLELKEPLFGAQDLVQYYPTFFYSLTEALDRLDRSSSQEVLLFEMIFNELTKVVHKLESSDEPESIETVGHYLQCVHEMTAKIQGEVAIRSLYLAMLDEVRKMPSAILCSKTYCPSLQRTPLECMLESMMDGKVLFSLENAEFRKEYILILQGFLKKGCVNKASALPLLNFVIIELDKNLKEGFKLITAKHELTSTLWKIIASQLKDHIDRHQDVNQEDGSNHNLKACNNILIFPLKHLSSDQGKGPWKLWTDLFRQVNNAAALLVDYKTLELEAAVAQEVHEQLTMSNASFKKWETLIKIVDTIVHEISFKSLNDKSDSDHDFLSPVVEAICDMIRLLPKFLKEEGCAASGKYLCELISHLLFNITRSPLVKILVQQLIPNLVELVRKESFDTLGRNYAEACDTMFSNSVTTIQSRYRGPFNKTLLTNLKPYLLITMSHQRREIRQKAQEMWQVTFAPSLSSTEMPVDIAMILRKSLMLSSDSSSQDTFSFEGGEALSPALTFGSFLNREENQQQKKNPSPLKEVKREVQEKESPFKAFKKPARRINLEDESSQDFVPIKVNNDSTKKRPLTEHQKEKFSKRSDDIPALYSELSREDSQVMMPPQFHSQASIDASDVAMDGSNFKLTTTSPKKTKDNWILSPKKSDSKITSPNKVFDKREGALSNPSLAHLMDLTSSSGTDSDSGETSSRKRKGRTPIKNLAPPTRRNLDTPAKEASPVRKKRGRPPKVRRTSSSVDSGTDSTSSVEVNEKTRTTNGHIGRRSEKAPTEETLFKPDKKTIVRSPEKKSTNESDKSPVKTAEEAQSNQKKTTAEMFKNGERPEVFDELSQTQKQMLRKDITVNLKRLSPTHHQLVKNSPVKVVQEKPLIIVCAPAVRKILPDAHPMSNGVGEVKSSIPESSNEEDIEIIESSQQQQTENISLRGKKRKRGEVTNLSMLSDVSPNAQIEEITEEVKTEKIKRIPSECLVANKENLTNQKPQQQQRVFKVPKNKYGETALHTAAKKGDLERVKTLLEKGVDVNIKDNAGWSPLHESMRDSTHSLEIMQLLIDHGANVNTRADDGNTPLHDACATNREVFIKILVANGADPKILNKDNKRPLDLVHQSLAPLLNKDPLEKEEVTSVESSEALDKEESTGKVEEKEESVKEGDDEVSSSQQQSSASILSHSVRSPLPNFNRMKKSVPLSGRGAKMLEMSKNKGQASTEENSTASPSTSASSSSAAIPGDIMSPKVVSFCPSPVSSDNLTTPTQTRPPRPWEKYQPSPSTASPSSSILKKSFSGPESPMSIGPPSKRRRVQFMDPPVSEKVEIPRCQSNNIRAAVARQRLAATKFSNDVPAMKSVSNDEDESLGLYEATPPIDSSANNSIYPGLSDCVEPVASILANLANLTWQKAAEKSLKDNGITNISQLCKITPSEAQNLKGLKPPNNVATIVDALRKFERERGTRLNYQQQANESIAKKIASIADVTTPEEDEQTIKDIYERPSPSPTEEDQERAMKNETTVGQQKEVEVELDGMDTGNADAALDEKQESEFNIPTIVEKKMAPLKLLVQDTNNERSEKVETFDKDCQVSPPAIVTKDMECATEPSITAEQETQVEVAEVKNGECQTEDLSMEERLENILKDLKHLETNQIYAVLKATTDIIGERI